MEENICNLARKIANAENRYFDDSDFKKYLKEYYFKDKSLDEIHKFYLKLNNLLIELTIKKNKSEHAGSDREK
jgi:hypothetical protein